MKVKFNISLVMLFFTFFSLCQVQGKKYKSNFPVLKDPYLGQKPPGMTPEPFVPGLLPEKYWWHSSPAFSPDGKEVYFSAFIKSEAYSERIMYMKMENDHWTPPKVAPFSEYFEGGPCFTPDGNKIFYSSARPLIRGGKQREDRDIWYVERIADGWGEPFHASFNTDTWEDRVYVSDLGNIYFKSNNDIYRVKMVGSEFLQPEKLSDAINSEYGEQDPCIAPDESFMIFYSSRPGHLGKEKGDLYVSFRKKDNTWTKAVNMGPTFNKGHIITRFPRLSPDGKYLFFSKLIGPRNDKIFWVDAKIIEKLRPEEAIVDPKTSVLEDVHTDIDSIVLSHKHRDHTHGLSAVFNKNNKVEITNSIGMKLRLIPPGSFIMGGDLENEEPSHRVEITKPFYMGVYEVTQEQYEKVMGKNPSGFKGPNLPVERVSWNAAMEFCERLSLMTGEKYRLPTEAEWEYAARGGLDSRKYVWGDQDVPEVNGRKQANVADVSYSLKYDWPPFKGYDDGFAGTSPVGSFAPNNFGLHDMSGNVWERCSDWYEDHYFSQSPEKDPKGPNSGTRKVLRGGGWGSGPKNTRVAFRCGTPLDRGGDNDGFRVVKEVNIQNIGI